MTSQLIKHSLGFWTVAEKPSSDELQRYYAEKYYQQGLGSYDTKYRDEEIAYFKAKIEQRYHVLNRQFKEQGRLLDVGCGEGFALAFFRDRGWDVRGLDFSSAGVMAQNPQCKEVLRTGDLFSLLNDELASVQQYDVVWLQNVLEHVIDPVGLLESLKRLVTSEGGLVVTVPNDFSVAQRFALGNGYVADEFWVAIPDHLNYFDHQSLPATVDALGWECLELLGDFPVDWFLFNPHSNYVRDGALGKAAHLARVQIENMLHGQPIETLLEFWSAAGRLGVGRDITVFLRPKEAK
ncbi:SmtA SAM-dependent methyltransferases [Oxalobacteraceae bacterium]